MTGSNNPRPYVVTLKCDGASRELNINAYEVMEALIQANIAATASGAKVIEIVGVAPDPAALAAMAETERAARAADVNAILRGIRDGQALA